MTHHYLLSHLLPDAAARQPEATAVVCGDDTVTWAELDRRVGALAATLAERGVRTGDRVGIHLHKSIETVVAVHGIMRSGAAYVPIDPMAPVATVDAIVADCDIEVLVTHPPRRRTVEALTNAVVTVGIDPTWDEVYAAEPIGPVSVLGDELAYIVFTSGSTGRPKGIMHTHRSGLAYAEMTAELYGLTPDDRLANFSPLHFDMSTFEMLSSMVHGSQVVVVPEPHLRMPASLTAYIADKACTTLYTVPSLFQQMMSRGALDQRDLSAVRWVKPAGEAFPPDALVELMRIIPHARFANVYGPAEVNHCTHHLFGGPGPVGTAPAGTDRRYDPYLDGTKDPTTDPVPPLPIGGPSPNSAIELLTDDDEPVIGPGVGKLVARCATMMVGYWNRPDLTEASMVDRPGNDGRIHRWYRTGDVVERTADGDLIFLGRSDNQVKVRGNRVELETVESAIGGLPGIENAVVGVRTDGAGDAVLICRYVPAPPAGSEASTVADHRGDEDRDDAEKAWRAAAAKVVPAYAVPSAFEPVDSLPLTPSGKIDRRTVRQAIAGTPSD